MQGEATLLERKPKYKSNLFGSIFELRRVLNIAQMQHFLVIIKDVETCQGDLRQIIDQKLL